MSKIVLPDSLRIIASGAFDYCVSLSYIIIPSSVSQIGLDNIFFECRSLSHLIVDSKNKCYDSRGNCNAIVETATNTLIVGCSNTVIPNTVETIADSALSFTNIEAVFIPESVKHIGKGVLKSCNKLKHIIVSKFNPAYDSREDCNAIIHSGSNTLISGCKETVIPYGVTVIDAEAFYGITDLTDIEIPDTVHTIGEYAFAYCKNLKRVRIPDGVKILNSNAFCQCEKLSLSIADDCEFISDNNNKIKKVIRRKPPRK